MEKQMENLPGKDSKAQSSGSSEFHKMVLQVRDVLPDTAVAIIECDLSKFLKICKWLMGVQTLEVVVHATFWLFMSISSYIFAFFFLSPTFLLPQ